MNSALQTETKNAKVARSATLCGGFVAISVVSWDEARAFQGRTNVTVHTHTVQDRLEVEEAADLISGDIQDFYGASSTERRQICALLIPMLEREACAAGFWPGAEVYIAIKEVF